MSQVQNYMACPVLFEMMLDLYVFIAIFMEHVSYNVQIHVGNTWKHFIGFF